MLNEFKFNNKHTRTILIDKYFQYNIQPIKLVFLACVCLYVSTEGRNKETV